MSRTYQAHGLTVVSDFELPLPTGEASAADLVLRRGTSRAVAREHPRGTRLAEFTGADGRLFYSLARDGDRVLLRYPELCEFVGDAAMRSVTAHPHPDADVELIPVLAAGALLAVHLMLGHQLVLHASAVRSNGRAIAFVGASGMGKSTLAAALCGASCELVADDVLRVDGTADGMLAFPGSTESRLRPAARELADIAPAGAVRATADGRLALRPRAHVASPLPLTACVVPLPNRELDEVVVRRLPPALALLRMCQFPRILGWCEPASADHAFQSLADLVEQVPVYEAAVPWGPPFRSDVLAGLLDAVTA